MPHPEQIETGTLFLQHTLAKPAGGSAEPATHSKRILELDGVRAIAILAVFIHHSLNVPLLWMGVDAFFVLSGFLITGILLRVKERNRNNYFRHFYSRRARRILLPYLLALLVSTLFFGTAWTRYWYWFAFFATNIGSAFGQYGHESLVVLWSLGVEEQFYLFWPVVILMVSEKRLFRIACSVILFCPLLRALATPLFSTHFPIYFLTPFRMDLLCAGAVLSIIWRKEGRAGFARMVSPARWMIGAGLIALLFCAKLGWLKTSSNTPASNAFIYVFGLIFSTGLIILALGGDRFLCPFLRAPLVRFVGIISYSMYLIHVSVILLVREYIPSTPAIMSLIALLVTILYAACTWYGFERRMLNSSS